MVKGSGVGRVVDFPTAKIDIQDDTKLVPADGVYHVKIFHKEEQYTALLSIGTNPTIDRNNKRTIEAYILDFDQAIYGEKIRLEVIEFLRPQITFDSIDGLIEKMKQDELEIRARLV